MEGAPTHLLQACHARSVTLPMVPHIPYGHIRFFTSLDARRRGNEMGNTREVIVLSFWLCLIFNHHWCTQRRWLYAPIR